MALALASLVLALVALALPLVVALVASVSLHGLHWFVSHWLHWLLHWLHWFLHRFHWFLLHGFVALVALVTYGSICACIGSCVAFVLAFAYGYMCLHWLMVALVCAYHIHDSRL